MRDNRAVHHAVAAFTGTAAIDDPVEFGNWCAHGYALLEQERHRLRQERSQASAPQSVQAPQARTATIDGDQIPMMEPSGPGPTPEQAQRWAARYQRHAAAGSYSQPDETPYPQAQQSRFDAPPLPDPNAIAAQVRDMVQRELASLRDQAYAANAMPQVGTPFVAPVAPAWPSVARPGGYMPGRRY